MKLYIVLIVCIIIYSLGTIHGKKEKTAATTYYINQCNNKMQIKSNQGMKLKPLEVHKRDLKPHCVTC